VKYRSSLLVAAMMSACTVEPADPAESSESTESNGDDADADADDDAATSDSGDDGAGETTGGMLPTTEACFEDPEYFVLEDGPWDPTLADVDLDGRMDIVGTDGDFDGVRFVTLLGTDAAPWFVHAASSDATGGGGPSSGQLSFGDMEGDGNVDMLFRSVIYLGDGAGTFTYAGVPSLPFGFGGLAAFVTLDSDAISDGIASSFDDPSMPIGTFLGEGNGNFPLGPSVALPSPAYGLSQTLHVGAEGGPDDLLVMVQSEDCGGGGWGGGGGCADASRRPVFMANLGDGAFDATEGEPIDGAALIRTRVDFDGDGELDLIGNSGSIAWIRHGPGHDGEDRIGELPLNEVGAFEIDDEDGVDVFGLGDAGGPALIVYSGMPPEGVREPQAHPLDFSAVHLLTLDLEGDGAEEILLFGMRNGEWTMAVMRPRSCA
jgi:hypothetical protein